MKLALGLANIAFALFCFAGYLVARWVVHEQAHHGYTLPGLTGLVFRNPYWLGICPLVAGIVAYQLGRRAQLTGEIVVTYLTSLAIAFSVILIIVLSAALLAFTSLR